ncbi:hypothetical protein M0Q50_10490 [bacterium]|jgi:hypothetical protein|nr:hypothetical protein [bacterium]
MKKLTLICGTKNYNGNNVELFESYTSDAKKETYDFVKTFNNEEQSYTLLITDALTLYSFNNCILRSISKDNDELKDIPILDSNLVEIYDIGENGELINIKSELGTVGKNKFNELMAEVMDDYYDVLTYLEIKK